MHRRCDVKSLRQPFHHLVDCIARSRCDAAQLEQEKVLLAGVGGVSVGMWISGA